AYCRALEARAVVLETHARRLEWQRQAADDFVVKFATCTLLDAALTWWNSQIRTLGLDAYIMTWSVLKKKMTAKYCPLGEVKKLEIKLWNLKVRDNNIPAYTNRFQELALVCTKFVSNETEKVDKYISGLPDNIYRNVKSSKPKTSTGNTNATNNQGGNGPNPRGNGCFECGDPRHFKRDCPKLKNKNGEMEMPKDGCML
nr:reverse transcriptase domain-containing protein [Tanacetum cinerariifolium]